MQPALGNDAHSAAAPADAGQRPHQALEANAAVQSQVDTLVSAYLDLSDLLAHDSTEGAPAYLRVIRDSARDLTASHQKTLAVIGERIAERATSEAEDIAAFRATFKSIGPPAIELVHAIPPSAHVAPVIREAYCPMVKASWLQTGDTVTNPYFGSEMRHCGRFTATIETQTHVHR